MDVVCKSAIAKFSELIVCPIDSGGDTSRILILLVRKRSPGDQMLSVAGLTYLRSEDAVSKLARQRLVLRKGRFDRLERSLQAHLAPRLVSNSCVSRSGNPLQTESPDQSEQADLLNVSASLLRTPSTLTEQQRAEKAEAVRLQENWETELTSRDQRRLNNGLKFIKDLLIAERLQNRRMVREQTALKTACEAMRGVLEGRLPGSEGQLP